MAEYRHNPGLYLTNALTPGPIHQAVTFTSPVGGDTYFWFALPLPLVVPRFPYGQDVFPDVH